MHKNIADHEYFWIKIVRYFRINEILALYKVKVVFYHRNNVYLKNLRDGVVLPSSKIGLNISGI